MASDKTEERKQVRALQEKSRQVEANRLYASTGDHTDVAREMGVSLKTAYKLVGDGFEAELAALRGADSEEMSALHMHEYITMLDKLKKLEKVIYDIGDPKMMLQVLAEWRKTVATMDTHLEKTGKFVKREEHVFVWEDAKDDPEMANLFLSISDHYSVLECPECGYKGFDIQLLLDFINAKMQEHRARDTVVDVGYEDVGEE